MTKVCGKLQPGSVSVHTLILLVGAVCIKVCLLDQMPTHRCSYD